jgi:hypothetical protein
MTFQPNQTNWEPPDGLGYSSLRPVRLSGQGMVLAVMSIVFLLGGPAFGIFINPEIQRNKQRDRVLSEQGADATATIMRVWRDGGKNDTHMVSYRFTVDGRDIEGKSSMHRSAWVNLREGDSLAIRYVPTSPGINHPASGTSGAAPDWLPWLMVGVFVWPPFLFWAMIRRQSRLLSEGRPAPATVTKVRHAKQVIAYYEFALLSGQVMKGRSQVNRRSAVQPGAQACALYLPDNPRRNALYPLELVKLQK